jgi:hypothetical protein
MLSQNFEMLVRHTEADREWAYDRKSSIGRLDKALDEAPTKAINAWRTRADERETSADCGDVCSITVRKEESYGGK